jgi:hypothetical protein
MRFATVLIPVMLLLCLILPTGLLAVLEYFLAKLESPWPGRALPILSFLSSLCVSAVLLFNTADLTALPVILVPLLALAVLNLPTLVFCAVYRSTRRKYVEQRGVDRMNIQDSLRMHMQKSGPPKAVRCACRKSGSPRFATLSSPVFTGI